MRYLPATGQEYETAARGSVLLEVVLALTLFAAAALIIGSGLSTSFDSIERLRLNTHAANLAISVMAELQMGTKSLTLDLPEPLETPFDFWTWEAVALPMTTALEQPSDVQPVEVIIRHEHPPVEYHLTQMVRLGEGQSTVTDEFFF
jgi:type II secretory pathway pseudopilin PulG